MGFGMMRPGVAFLVMIGMLVLIVVGLVASGIVKINVEVRDKDEDKEELDLEEIKALDDSTWSNRLLKWLAKIYEKELAKKEAEDKDENKNKKDYED